jgi:hypothetical protein
MSDYSTRNIIDYAFDGDGTKFREELYGSIHDRISAHIESKKQEIARDFVGQNEEVVNEASQEIKVHSDDGKHIGTITHGKYQSVAYAHPNSKFGATKQPRDDEDSMLLKGPEENKKGEDFIKAHHKEFGQN